jgi:hypothetical protein
MGYMLSHDGSGKIRESVEKYWNGCWKFQLTEGVGKNTQDAGHYSEEGSSNLGMKMLVQYGDPVSYARTLQATKKMLNWFARDSKGNLKFKSFFTGPDGAWTEGAFNLLESKTPGHSYDVMISAGYLVWYNMHPKAAEIIKEIKPSSNDFLPSAYDRVTDFEAAKKKYYETLKNPIDTKNKPYKHISAINAIGLSEEIKKIHKVEYKMMDPIPHYRPWQPTDVPWLYWKFTGDERFLIDSYTRLCEWFYSHDWLNSEAMPSMDRCPLPRNTVIRSRIGATAANRGSSHIMWPYHAISFSEGADELASLVTENLPNKFSVRLFPYIEKDLKTTIRTWRCNGTFNATLSLDKNLDGKADSVVWEKKIKLDRGAAIDLTLKAGVQSILTVTPIKIEKIDYEKADPAISRQDAELLYGDHLVVKVYNNGNKAVNDVLVRVTDIRTGKTVVNGEKRTGPIEAPLDLVPKWKRVEFKNINCNTWGGYIIEIDPDKKIDDFNRHNNKIVIRYRSTFDLHKGWH